MISRSARAALTWSVAGAVLASTALLLAAAVCSPEQITRSPRPLITVLHVIAAGICLHCMCILPVAGVVVWRGAGRRWLRDTPRALAIGSVLAPPLLATWLFVFRTGRLDITTLAGTVFLAAFAGWASFGGARRLEGLDAVASRLAPVSLTVLLAAVPGFLAIPTFPRVSTAQIGQIAARGVGNDQTPALAAEPSPSHHPRTVLLLTIDTLRADHLGAWGYPRVVSPNLDRLGAEGTVFEDAMAASSGTVPSVGAIHTGLPPDCSGVVDQRSALAPAETTLAERFSRAGYATLGVATNSLLSAKRGFDQGFDTFENLGEVDGDEVVARMTDLWQELPTDKSVFAWVHLYDPHTPYLPPEEDWRGFVGDALWSDRKIPTTRFSSWGGVNLYRTLGKDTVSVNHVTEGEVVARYDGEILSADRSVGRLLSWLSQAGRLDDAIILFTADHGETMVRGRRDIVCQHAFQLYDDSVHVPLILWGSGIPATRSVARAQHIDILPTLLAVAGLPADPAMPGHDLLAADLGPATRMASTAWWDAVSLKLVPHMERTPSRLVRIGNWKLIVHPHTALASLNSPAGWLDAWRNLLSGIWRDDQLYELASDPGELRDRAAERPGDASRLRAALAEAMAVSTMGCAIRDAAGLNLDDETLRSLRALGYLE